MRRRHFLALATSPLAAGLHGAAAAAKYPDKPITIVVPFPPGNLDQDITVLDLAGIACMSVGHFTRSFSAATGRAPHAFVAERRLVMAKRRLRDESCSIEEIAFSAGFSSLANFSKAFRHSTGLSPSQFRARS